jgi:hypothetical protein
VPEKPLTEQDLDLVAQFEAAMENIYHAAKREAGYNATRFLLMVHELGGLQAAHRLLAGDRIHDGFGELLMAGRPDLTVEALVLNPEFQSLFGPEELKVARERLGR